MVLEDAASAQHPLIYADQMHSLAVGPFTSRVTVTVDSYGQGVRLPAATLIMPTQALHELAKRILAQLSEQECKSVLGAAYADYLNLDAVEHEALPASPATIAPAAPVKRTRSTKP